MPLLHDEERSTWSQWFAQQNVRRTRHDGQLFEGGLLTLVAVQAGLGWAARSTTVATTTCAYARIWRSAGGDAAAALVVGGGSGGELSTPKRKG